MAVNKLISIKSAVIEATEDMGIDHGKNTAFFTRMAARAEAKIGSYYSFRRLVKAIVIDKFRAEIPCEARYIQRVVFGDFCDTPDLFNFNSFLGSTDAFTATNDTNTFLVIDKSEGSNTFCFGDVRWEVQDNHIILSADYDKQVITVQYLGLQTDKEGFPLVMEDHVEAIVAYIMYRYAVRSRFSPIKMDLGDVTLLKREWNELRYEAVADDSEISESDRNEIVQMISDPLTGRGMDIYTGYNNYYFGSSLY